MTKPDEALLWARDAVVCPWAETDPEYCREVQAGWWDDEGNVEWRAEGYRAGAAASDARIKALEEALRDEINQCSNDECVRCIKNRALLKEADQ